MFDRYDSKNHWLQRLCLISMSKRRLASRLFSGICSSSGGTPLQHGAQNMWPLRIQYVSIEPPTDWPQIRH